MYISKKQTIFGKERVEFTMVMRHPSSKRNIFVYSIEGYDETGTKFNFNVKAKNMKHVMMWLRKNLRSIASFSNRIIRIRER